MVNDVYLMKKLGERTIA